MSCLSIKIFTFHDQEEGSDSTFKMLQDFIGLLWNVHSVLENFVDFSHVVF